MTFPILGGNGAVAGVAQANSLRFNDDDSAHLSRTPSSSSNRKTWTWSGWVKRSTLGTQQKFFVAGTSDSNRTMLYFETDDTLRVYFRASGIDYGRGTGSAVGQVSTAIFRDVSAYYHILISVDLTASDASSPLRADANRLKFYVNGIQQINDTSHTFANYSLTQNTDTLVNHTNEHSIGLQGSDNTGDFDGYMAEVHLVDGQALSPTDFGEFDSSSGIWKPKDYSGSYGTNGFKLNFSNSGSLGADSSGNGNNFTATNLASTDQTTDTPTNNFCTLNSIYINGASSNIAPTYSEGNTITNSGGSGTSATRTSSTFEFSSGKWYWEVKVNDSPSAVDIGINNNTIGALCGIRQDGTYFTDNNNQGTLTSFTSGDIISFAFDMDNKKMYIAKNGTYMNSANPSTSTNGISFTTTDSMHCQFKSRQDDSLSANFGNPPFSITSGNSDDNGYGNFEYAPPSGYLALCTQNLATELSPTIDDGSQYFNTVTYTGDGAGSNSITGVGFQPDWTWIKARSQAYGHMIYDSVRGANKQLGSQSQSAENNPSPFGTLSSFNSDGFTVGTGSSNNLVINQSGQTFVSWNWKASGSTASNTDGTNASTVSVNQTAGFSIVSYTRNSDSVTTVGHGLGKTPKVLIEKDRDTSGTNWAFITTAIDGTDDYSFLNTTNTFGATTANAFTTTTFRSSMGANQGDIIAYVFAEIEGYSKFGKFSGNSSLDGPMIYTGFSTKWVMYKNITSATDWMILDDKRIHNASNAQLDYLEPNTSDAEGDMRLDFLSNGFKLREGSESGAKFNLTGETYIYMAFASNPFVSSSGVPVTAR
jgi:hypothetical protein